MAERRGSRVLARAGSERVSPALPQAALQSAAPSTAAPTAARTGRFCSLPVDHSPSSSASRADRAAPCALLSARIPADSSIRQHRAHWRCPRTPAAASPSFLPTCPRQRQLFNRSPVETHPAAWRSALPRAPDPSSGSRHPIPVRRGLRMPVRVDRRSLVWANRSWASGVRRPRIASLSPAMARAPPRSRPRMPDRVGTPRPFSSSATAQR